MKGVFLLSCIFFIIPTIYCEEAFVIPQVDGFKGEGNFIYGHDLCARNNMTLPMPLSAEDNKLLTDFLDAHQLQRTWLAATDYGIEGQFRWITTGLPILNFFWHPGQPDNYANIEDCIEMWYVNDKWAWNDVNCKAKCTIVCEPIYDIDLRIKQILNVKPL